MAGWYDDALFAPAFAAAAMAALSSTFAAASMAESATGNAFFAGDNFCSRFRLRAAADNRVAITAPARSTINIVIATSTTAGGMLLAVEIRNNMALRIDAIPDFYGAVVAGRCGKCQGCEQGERDVFRSAHDEGDTMVPETFLDCKIKVFRTGAGVKPMVVDR